ncbi:hypothetical protein BHQ23_28320 [Mycobacterium gordonae]|uniref:Uncharacterized protein n=1 Tax=Mycobacterium gordonae TaxID=1778 RepID=A0A1X1X1K5_MYCGO|nr:hypothetical protein BHQ23_28320 [Mycobacterium gordonae]ORV92633.1 hypothetical protein AWC08_19210 [Mycobacterium gordonae]
MGLDKDHPTFQIAIRDLETAALIARISRPAVQQYLLLADAARRYSLEDYDIKGGDEEIAAGMINSDLGNVVQESAEIVTQLAWRPWWSRITYRPTEKSTQEGDRHRRQRCQAAARLHAVGADKFPGSLGELYDEYFPNRKRK